MSGILILLLLILSAALPAVIVFFWLRFRKPAFSLLWFLAALSAGIVSFLVAALVQRFFPPYKHGGLFSLFFSVFIRIAFAEEASRIVTLIPFYKIGRNRAAMDKTFGATLGLAAGLGFAMIENAY